MATATTTAQQIDVEDETCAWNDADCAGRSAKDMVPIQVNLPNNNNNNNTTFMAYVTPDVSTFYQEAPGTRKARVPAFQGLFGKFINLSKQRVQVFWDAGRGKDPAYIADIDAFGSASTATFPGHRFFVFPVGNTKTKLTTWDVVGSTSLYIYDPYDQDGTTGSQLNQLTDKERAGYDLQKNNLLFNEQYKAVTGREYLSLYPFRKTVLHPLWPADYFGQEHTVSTAETHFASMPPDRSLRAIKHQLPYKRHLPEYRIPGDTMNMTLKALSCAPRVFEIDNFLSTAEVQHILELATGMKLDQSTTKAGSTGNSRVDDSTRTSRNAWVRREQSPVVDAIYRRAADLMRMDESYLRSRHASETVYGKDVLSNLNSNAEQLQLVHYGVGQQYTPHHDFVVPSVSDKGQPMRYATILFYLNEGMKGGQTAFPRWKNGHTSNQLLVEPKVGKAVLFYNLLPDGNMDDLSQHAALPVTSGEKWLINLWTWDPMMRHFY